MSSIPCSHCAEVEGQFGRWVPTTLVLEANLHGVGVLSFKCYCGKDCTINEYESYTICSCERIYRWYLERGLERFQTEECHEEVAR